MMRLIDEKGKLFSKINIIDLLVFVVVSVIILPMLWFGYKIITKEPELLPIKTFYEVTRPCPVCRNPIVIDTVEDEEITGILKGEPIPEFYETICPKCENKVILIKPKPESLPKEMNYMQEYYKRMLEKGIP